MSNIQLIFNSQKRYFKNRKTRDVEKRIEILKNLKSVIKSNEEEIFQALKKDLRKSQFESYISEVSIVYDEINIQIKNLRKWSKKKRVRSPLVHFPVKSFIYSEPYGVVLIIGPFNYPFQLTLAPLVGAIATGNTVMVKPSELSVATSNIIKKILQETFSEEQVAWINPAEGKAIVQELLTLKFDYIFFTGSIAVGKIIMSEAARNLIPVTLELGGKSPCIIDKDAKLEVAAKRIVWGKFLNTGQTCVAPDYLYVHEEIKEQFIEKLVKEIKGQYGVDALQSEDYPRIINSREFNRLIKCIDPSKVYYGGNYKEDEFYIEPTILDNVQWDDEVMTREIFGPIMPILNFNDLDTIIREINSRDKPLALYYFSEDNSKINKILNETTSGGVTVNDTVIHVSSSYLPFGGVGKSGMGRYHGKASFDLFSHKKSVMKRGTWLDPVIRYAPFKDKLEFVKKFLK